MTQRTFPGMEETDPISKIDNASLDYGEFMLSTTPQERMRAIRRFFAHVLDPDTHLTANEILALMDWMVEAAGPQGYEVVPLDWIRKLRQQKAGIK